MQISQMDYDSIVWLQKISRLLHKSDEYDCNYPRSELGEKRAEAKEKKLMNEAEQIAGRFGLHA